MLNYEGQLLPPFMYDMEEYMACLDVIAECNHIETEMGPTEEQVEEEREVDPENINEETEQNDDPL